MPDPYRDNPNHAVAALELREARREDAARIEQLVARTGVLDRNSCYAYLLLCTHFADTSVVAVEEERLLGFTTAYRLPADPSCLFLWQIGVCPTAQGRGLGKRLLRKLVHLPACKSVRELHTTVSPSNRASRKLFEWFAREMQCALRVTDGFVPADFGAAEHEEEPKLVIGPLPQR